MKKVCDIVKIIEEFAPVDRPYIMKNDNNGLLVGNANQPVSKILCVLDVTHDIIDKAIDTNVSMIVSHHPIIFNPIKSVVSTDALGGKLLRLIKNDIAVYSSHTALDYCKDGINDYVCTLLGLKNVRPLDEFGVGRIGELPAELNGGQLKALVDKTMGDGFTSFVGVDKQFSTVAIMNGGAGDIHYVDMALKANADCFISGDFRQHVFVYAVDSGLSVIDCSHKSSEESYLPTLAQFLRDKAQVEVAYAASGIIKR